MGADRLSFAVLGPGGVGGFLAALLTRAGSPVVVLAGAQTSRLLDANGIHLESQLFGKFSVPVRTAPRLPGPVDVCIVAVKATDLQTALDRVPAGAFGRGLVVPFLNGLEHVEFLRTVYGDAAVAPGTIRIETTRVEPGVIRHTSPFATVELASSDRNRHRVEAIAHELKAAGLDVSLRDDEKTMLWDKFAFLAPMALLTTHERDNLGAIRTRRRADAIALIREVAAIAAADGVIIDPAAVVALLDSLPESMETSMQRDHAAGKPLELDALGGALLRRARRAGIAAPTTARLVDELQARTHSAVAETGES